MTGQTATLSVSDRWPRLLTPAGVLIFTDDSALNCRAATARGWTTAHIVEPTEQPPAEQASKYLIRSLEELRKIFPQFFKQQ